MAALRLKVPAPHTLEYTGIPNCIDLMSDDERRELSDHQASRRRSTFHSEKGNDRIDITGRLPALPRATAHPQTFVQTMDFIKPTRWPFWFEMEEEQGVEEDEDNELYDEYERYEQWGGNGIKEATSSTINGVDCPKFVSPAPPRKKEPAKPPSYLSPFAEQVRQMGGDVVVTGKKLDMLKKPKPHWDDFGPPAEESRHTSSTTVLSQDPIRRPKEGTKAAKAMAMKVRPTWRGPSKSDNPWRRGDGRDLKKGVTLPSSLSRSPSAPSLLQGIGAILQGYAASQASLHMPVDDSHPRLAAGRAELWDGSEKLSAIRDLLDAYAADPLRASPQLRTGGTTETGRPSSSSSASFLAHYVERQADIERLLNEKAVPLVKGARLGE
mmetsp:Transcript_82413/g.212342  ORF Transcript_82413/g.212342 Transcript_82413/m.212342 type:complete len:382 (-) Transcript_82413:275-1420(-)